ncbi:hypothetical protein LTR36_000722 [Oleoguttula mirabilis]|uniref:Uncharacterized protein n=1 Tax=Oleoguttula mirabilis TaxID=1507867 RepID=A0AAV9JQX4_9PEZI|nr:hypothetical protein LTR36_000722 [Oleoguttula mirabilis]
MNSTARILSFQPNSPSDVMPSSRKIKKHGRFHSINGFDLYDDEREARKEQVDIYTDPNARVPEMDEAEDNPFIGPKKSTSRPQRKGRRAPTAEEQEMEEAAQREEGVVYVFRGKKVFRRFSDPREERASSAGTEISDVPGQRTLRRQAGPAAQRPLTRSAIKPRLLFPSEEQLLERDQGLDDVDEEAVTDIEMPNASSPVKQKGKAHDLQTPTRHRFKPATPPRTSRATRSMDKNASPVQQTPIYEDEPEPMSVGADERFPAQSNRKPHSPFDTWQRTKTGRKRSGDAADGAGSGKRTRSSVAIESPA